MTLTDAGPLVALIDADEPDHARCVAALDALTLPLVTSWAAFTEAMYLLGDAGGWPGQAALWRMIERGTLRLQDIDATLCARCVELMGTYRDHPMDLADATLVALAEAHKHRRIFTLDGHFRSYQLRDRTYLITIPE